jgi:hypothetical protein
LPISAFLAQQGHDSVFTPPVPDENAWTNSAFDPGVNNNSTLLLWGDYTGQTAAYLQQHGINLGTKVTGFVTETPIGNTGQMEVTVNLEATNALTWAANIANINPNQADAVDTAPLEFGYRPQDLVANPSLKPALSDIHFQLSFQEQVGAALPDLPRLNENYSLYAPPGFQFEVFDMQFWGTGTLAATNDIGTPGQTALVYTNQVADLANATLPGTFADGSWREPIDIVPVSGPATHVAYLNGTVFVMDQSSQSDNVAVVPAAGGGATVVSNLGHGTFPSVKDVVIGLGGGNNNVLVTGLPAASVNVAALGGNNNVTIVDASKVAVHLGGGDNNVFTAGVTTGEFLGVGGTGDNNIIAAQSNFSVILVAGTGNNNIAAGGAGDVIEVVSNGNDNVIDSGTNATVDLGGNGNDNVLNAGAGSVTFLWSGTGNKRVLGTIG